MTKTLPKKKNPLLIIIAAVLIVAVIVSILFFPKPERSVANFCRVAKEEKSNFQSSTSAEQLLNTFRKMDNVAPSGVRSDTSSIVKGYELIVSDPSKAPSTELGVSGSQTRVSDYITKNCPNYF